MNRLDRTATRGATALALAALLSLAACESGPGQPDKSPPPRPTAPPAASAPSANAEAKPPPVPTASSSAAPATGDLAALAGRWEGQFDAKKGSVVLPPKVKDKGLAADEGKALTGPGSIELTVTKSGDVTGKGKGALGAITISGTIDGAMLRTTVTPDDPHAPDAVTGVLVGPIKDGTIKARLRVSVAKADAVLVREAEFELKKKP